MNVIFSRKGFDSSVGGFPSPIFPDGTMVSIPIPSLKSTITYKDFTPWYVKLNHDIHKVLNDITKERIKFQGGRKKVPCDYFSNKCKAHFDPMIIKHRGKEFIAFGQQGRAAAHLKKQLVEEGDIFLFFGWFKRIENIGDTWIYSTSSLDLHIIWAYMKIERIIDLSEINKQEVLKDFPFLSSHPHWVFEFSKPNIIFLSSKIKLFNYDQKRVLTNLDRYKGRSYWKLPIYFNQPQAFSFLKNFAVENHSVHVKSPGRGQEFVLNLDKVDSKERELILQYLKSILR